MQLFEAAQRLITTHSIDWGSLLIPFLIQSILLGISSFTFRRPFILYVHV
jgi:hypothetical protein